MWHGGNRVNILNKMIMIAYIPATFYLAIFLRFFLEQIRKNVDFFFFR